MTQKLLLFFVLLTGILAQGQKRIVHSGLQQDGKATTTQGKATKADADSDSKQGKTGDPDKKASFDMYRVITLDRDTTYIDTSLSIHKEYTFNYLRRDNFGLMPFSNDGQTYNTLQYSLNQFSPFPEFGYNAKQFFYLQPNDIKYYSVATPLTELYFKTTTKQGQSIDAFITINTSERLNFSIAYKGLRSLGKYLNSLSSAGNFRFTTSYNTKDTRYYIKAHLTAQDNLNGENGGIVNNDDFESGDTEFKDRARLQVFFTDAESFMKGNRYFIDHGFRFNKKEGENNLYFTHQFNFENKFFRWTQNAVGTTITETDETIFHLGDAYLTSGINDQTRYHRLYNKVGAIYENKTFGQFQFYVDDFKYHYFYNSVIVNENSVIPSAIRDKINTFGAQYGYRKGKWSGTALYSNSITNQSLSNLDLSAKFDLNDENTFSFHFQKMQKLPDLIYDLFQSSYINYNWQNDFNNEKINNLTAKAETKFGDAELQLTTIKDKLYFSDDSTVDKVVLVSPKQYDGTINYVSLKVSKEFSYGKFALDNTVLYQKTVQDENILNVPELVTRNTFYYSDNVFKNAMFIQTGIIFNYFTKYYANDYNPLLGEFYVQDQKKIGAFPLIDFFINARVKQTRIYLKAEHFNSAMTGNHFYSAPSYPYRDFQVRFGLIWDFFQ